MRHRALGLAAWVFSRLVVKSDREALMGDLEEEYALRAKAASASAALKWYLLQMIASALPLLRVRARRATWIATVGVALLAYLAVGVVELIVNWAISSSSGNSIGAYNPVGMFVTFPLVVLIAYFAARFSRRAPIVLGAMMLLAVAVMTVSSGEVVPTWYRIAYFFVGPVAVVIGSALRSLRPARS